MLKLFNKNFKARKKNDFKAKIIKTSEQLITSSLETNEKPGNLKVTF